MQHRARRAFTALALTATFAAAAVAVRPADAAPRAFSVPVTGSLTTELVPLPLPIPALATFAGTVDDDARTISGSLSADPIEFDVDTSTLPFDIDGIPSGPISFKLKLVTPSGLSGSWTEGGVATLSGKIRLDIGETTIAGLPLGFLTGCYYEEDVQLVGTMDAVTGTLDVSDDDITVPGVTGLCAAVLSQLDGYITGLRFGFSMQAVVGTTTTSSTSSSSSSSSSSSTSTSTVSSSTSSSTTTTSTVASTSSTSTTSTTSTSTSSTTPSSTSEPTTTSVVSTSITTSPTATTPTTVPSSTTQATVSGTGTGRTPVASPAPVTRGSASYVG